MLKWILLLVYFVTLSSMAAVTCTTSNTGTTYCAGTDSSGSTVRTESYTTNTCTTYTTGTINGNAVHRECQTTNTGTTYCN